MPLASGLPVAVSPGFRGVVLSSTCWLFCDMERCGVVARLSLVGVVLPGVLPVWGVSGRDLKQTAHVFNVVKIRRARLFALNNLLILMCVLHNLHIL